MSVLKIKDQNNDWIQIPTIKGDKGDPFTYADFTPEQLEALKGKDGISPTVSVASDTSDDYRLSFTDETHTVTTPNLIPEAEKIFDVYPHDTASGAVASFVDGADDIPLKSCIVQVNPVQDLHGYDSPWPAGGWKNLLQNTATTQTASGVTFTVNADGTVSISGTATATAKLELNRVTLPEGSYIVSGGINGNCYVNVAGKVNSYGSDNSFSVASGGETLTVNLYVAPGATESGTFKPMIRLASVSDASYAPYENICPISGWTGCEVKHSGADTSNPTTYPITFPSETGTVYGGYVDVTGGELVVDRAIVDLGTLTWSKYGSSTIYYTSVTGKAVGNTNIISDTFFLDAVAIANMANGSMRGYSTNSNVYFRQDECADLSTWTTWVTNHHPHLVYELATPIHYPLTTTEIKTLLGQNNIWADTGDVSVEYRADVTKYIDRKITEAVSALT